MAANPIVRILLNAVDNTSTVLKSVGTGFGKFKDDVGKSVSGLKRDFETLISSKIVQFFGAAGIAGAIKQSWDAVDRLDSSMIKLQGTAKITGVPLETLAGIAAKAKDQFKLSTVQSNDFAVELAKLATKAGDVGQASAGLEAFLNIGAARGLTAAETLKAVQQSILGIDEGTDKLFGKNPSVLYEEYADKIGTTAGKLDDQQKAQALLTAAVEDGAKVQDAYNQFLVSGAGQQEQMKIKLEESAIAFGRATVGLRSMLLDAGTTLAGFLESFVGGLQLLGVDAAYYFGLIGPAAQTMKGNVLMALSEMIGESRIVLTLFGDAATDLADRLGDAGVRSVTQAQRDKRNLVTARTEMYAEITGVTTAGEKKVTTATATGATGRKKETKDEKEAREKHAKDMAKELERVEDEIAEATLRINQGLTAEQAKELVRRERLVKGSVGVQVKSVEDGYKALDRLNLQLAASFDKTVVPAIKRTEKDFSDLAENTTIKLAPLPKKIMFPLEQSIQGLSPGLRDATTVTAGLGQAFGVLDDQAANAIHNVSGLADAVLRMNTGDPTAFIGAIGSLGGLLSSLFGQDTRNEAREALTKHQDALDALTSVTGDLVDAQSSGRNLSALKGLAGIFTGTASIPEGIEGARNPRDNERFVREVLATAGLTLRDLKQAADDFGVDLYTEDGILDPIQLISLLQLISSADTGARKDYRGRIGSLETGLDIGTISEGQTFGKVVEATGGGNAITDLLSGIDVTTAEGRAAAITGLQDLFNRLEAGELTPEEFGNLSRGDFVDAITRLIGILRSDQQIDPFTLPSTPDRPPVDFAAGFDSIAAPMTESVDILASIDSTLARLAAVWFPVGGDPATALGGGASSVSIASPITVNVSGGGDPEALTSAIDAALTQRNRDLVEELDQRLFDRYQHEKARTGVVS